MTKAPAPQVTLACRSVWKLFGQGAEALARRTGTRLPGARLTAEAARQAGLIVALNAVDLEVFESEIFVIMGLSGSGKSTLLRCMSRLIEPTAGEILFKGEDLLAASEQRMIQIRRHQMGMVFQHFALLPHLSVLGNIAFPLEVQGVDAATCQERALRMVELIGLKGREDYFPRELSGGQQQRVGIARSLAVEPELWFLDEPFSALDPLIRREMQDEFIRLQASLHKTIVFITHDFDEAIRLADRVAIMKDGAVVQVGTPEQLVTAPADAYVAEFTKDVTLAKVVKVESVMDAAGEGPVGGSIAAGARIADAAPLLRESEAGLAVEDAAGRRIGLLRRCDVVDLMLRG